MNEAARRSYLRANASAQKPRQLKASGSTKMVSEALEDARWHRARARSLADR